MSLSLWRRPTLVSSPTFNCILFLHIHYFIHSHCCFLVFLCAIHPQPALSSFAAG